MKKLSFTFMMMVAVGALFIAGTAKAEVFPSFGQSFGSSPLIQSFNPSPGFMSPAANFGSPYGASGGIYGQIRIRAQISQPTQSYLQPSLYPVPVSNNITIVNNNNYYNYAPQPYNPYPPVYGPVYGGYGCGGSHGCGGGGYGYGGGYGGYGRGMYGARMCRYYRPRMCHHKQCGYQYARPYAKYNNTFVGVATPFGSVVVNNSSGTRYGF